MSAEQKIVYAGLSRMTQDRIVIQSAFQFWQANLSNKAFDVVEVTAKLVDYLGLNGQEKKVLMIALHASSNKAESELAGVPEYISQAGGSAVVDVPVEQAQQVLSNQSPHYQIIKGFINLFEAGVSRSSGEDFQEIDGILKDEGLDGVNRELNKQLKARGFTDAVVHESIEIDECRDLAHALYMLSIDVIGPVKSDVIINRVVDQLLLSGAASRFDPRTLL